MKAIGPSILLLLFLVLSPFAQDKKNTAKLVPSEDCSCTTIPFTPTVPCLNYCTKTLIARARQEELVLAFGLRVDSAKRIVAWEGKDQATSLEDYVKAQKLTVDEAQDVAKRINSFSKGQLDYFGLPERERMLMLASLVPHSMAVEDCKCTSTPFLPEVPCWNYCTNTLIAGASLEELMTAFGLKEDSARGILTWEGRTQASSLVDYVKAQKLTEAEAQDIKKRTNSFNKAQLQYFAMPARDRMLIMARDRERLFAGGE